MRRMPAGVCHALPSSALRYCRRLSFNVRKHRTAPLALPLALEMCMVSPWPQSTAIESPPLQVGTSGGFSADISLSIRRDAPHGVYSCTLMPVRWKRRLVAGSGSLRLQLQASQGTASKSLTRRARQTGLPCRRRCTPESTRRRGTPWGSPLLWVVRGKKMGGSLIEEPERVACHGSRHGMACCAMPRRAMHGLHGLRLHGMGCAIHAHCLPCHAMWRHAMPCHVAARQAMPCHAKQAKGQQPSQKCPTLPSTLDGVLGRQLAPQPLQQRWPAGGHGRKRSADPARMPGSAAWAWKGA